MGTSAEQAHELIAQITGGTDEGIVVRGSLRGTSFTIDAEGVVDAHSEDMPWVRMDPAVFNQVVLPRLETTLAMMGCSSTPLGPDNFYRTLRDLRDPDTGELVFDPPPKIQMCAQCTTKRLDYCPHMGPVYIPELKMPRGARDVHASAPSADCDPTCTWWARDDEHHAVPSDKPR